MQRTDICCTQALLVGFTVTAFALSNDAACMPQVRIKRSDTAPEQQFGAQITTPVLK
jgi:hypothetical protein